jgi:hypothetical protein
VTALLLSFILLAYVIVPGILVRRFISLFVPLRKPQWNRTEELTSAVLGTMVPFIAALILVKYVYWFGHHPFSFDDSSALRWSDYKTVFSASYSEKLYEDYLRSNNDAFWQTALRVFKRQSRLISWYYVASAIQALGIGLATYFYGDLRTNKAYEWFARKFVVPNISEWHVMLTPFTHPRKPKRKVRLEILTPDHKLYRGNVGDYHIDKDSCLTGVLLEDARRYDLRKYQSDLEKGQIGPSESYWRSIPGHALYMLADKIHNLNISYPPVIPMEEVAEKSLKGMNITAHVSSQEQKITSVTVTETPLVGALDNASKPEPLKNFERCPHCASKGRVFTVVRGGPSTPLVSRSDGRSYHLYLLILQVREQGPLKRIVAHFRYALDAKGITNAPSSVILADAITGPNERINEMVELVADELEAKLKKGQSLAAIYDKRSGQLTESRQFDSK